MNDDDIPTALDRALLDQVLLHRPELDLSELDVTRERAEHIRRRAHAILRAEHTAPAVGSLAYRFQRSIEPALLIGLALGQAVWATHGAWLLMR